MLAPGQTPMMGPSPGASLPGNGAAVSNGSGTGLPPGNGGSPSAPAPMVGAGASQAMAGAAAPTMMASGGAGVAAGADPNTVTIKMDEFTVPAGAELFMCQDFDNPFGGADVAIGRSESDMTPGSHHLHVLYGVGSPLARTVQPCADPNEFRPLLHIATLPHMVSAYPAGTAAKLKGATGLRLQVHYLNTGTTPIQASVVIKLTKVDPATVQHWVAQIHFNRVAMNIAPGTGQQVSTSCTIPSTFGPIGLLSAISHMHKQGVHFVATTSTGVPLLETTNWDDPPPTVYDKPVMLNPGDAINWTCTYNNDTGATLTYGDSAEKNEMCIYIARFFSSPNGDDLECEIPFPMGTATVKAN
jgi:hypothetical protein